MAGATSKQVRLVLVEDHEVVRMALGVLLERTKSIQVAGEVGTAGAALELVKATKPDVVLLDVYLPDGNGGELCRDIRAVAPGTKILLLTAFSDNETLLSALMGGADGYLHKTTGLDPLIRAIHTVASGQSYLDPQATHAILQWLRTPSACPLAGAPSSLSTQERRVVALVADGKTNKEIASALGLAEKTVKNYLRHAFEKLQITRRSQAAAIYCKTLSKRTASFPS